MLGANESKDLLSGALCSQAASFCRLWLHSLSGLETGRIERRATCCPASLSFLAYYAWLGQLLTWLWSLCPSIPQWEPIARILLLLRVCRGSTD